MHVPRGHLWKRQTEAMPTAAGVTGVATQSQAVTATGLIFDPNATLATYSAPPIAPSVTAVTVTPSSTTPVNPATSSATTSSASSSSSIPIGTVIGACVGAFAGFALLLLLFVFYCKRQNLEKSRGDPTSPGAANRNARGTADQGRVHDSTWKRLNGDNEDKCEERPDNRRDTEMVEKNFSMFKKSPSIYTTRTTKTISDEDHGYDLPPFEFSKYHPNLAAELALQQPPRPYAERQDSGISWGGSTVAEESYPSLRAMRVDSGTMSPTMVMAKTTPPTMSSPIHRWESAEVLIVEDDNVAGPAEVQNPFTDVHEERRSVANPFFNAQEMQRSRTLTRSRSNSRTNSRVSRARSMSQGHSRKSSGATTTEDDSFRASNPFIDVTEIPISRVIPPAARHEHQDSVASGSSANMFGDRAMKSLIAALEMTQEEVEERLRVVSMQASTISGVSSLTGLDDDETDIATVREFPMPPASNRAL